MRTLVTLLVAAILLATLGCAGMSSREQRVLSGGAIGAAAGVGTAALVGGPLIVGAAAGAAAGAVGGVILDEMQGSHR
jgi:osmotically inducible lipoprotein OsmB